MPPAAKQQGQTLRQQAKASGKAAGGDRASAQRDVIKPVFASPFTVPWPDIPNHLQLSVMAALPQLIPVEVADYHVSRQRCSRAAKRARRRKAEPVTDEAATGAATVARTETTAEQTPVYRPDVLDHLVLGLNETTKELDRGIAELRLRMAILADSLQATSSTPRFLPTAPPSAAPFSSESPIVFVLVPHISISPFSLIEDLATRIATHNTLLRQHGQLKKATHAPQFAHLAHLATDTPEIRLVPLGRREAEFSAAAGLRRLASFAVRASHPALPVLERLLPTSILHPPRHSVTLPWPSTRVAVHDATGENENGKRVQKKEEAPIGDATQTLAVPPIEYAALHIKGVHTTAPADATARKARRLLEVRAKRLEAKKNKLAARKKMEQSVRNDIKKHAGQGRAARLAAKGKVTSSIPSVPVPA